MLAALAGAPPSIRRYSAAAPDHVGFLQLELAVDGTALFLNVVTVHLPPVELERLKAKVVTDEEGRRCLSPAPATIEPCFVVDGARVTVVTKPDRRSLVLARIPEKR